MRGARALAGRRDAAQSRRLADDDGAPPGDRPAASRGEVSGSAWRSSERRLTRWSDRSRRVARSRPTTACASSSPAATRPSAARRRWRSRCARSAASRLRAGGARLPRAGVDDGPAPGARQAQDPRRRHPLSASPTLAELPQRLEQVLAVLYLVFNEGYLASDGAVAERRELASRRRVAHLAAGAAHARRAGAARPAGADAAAPRPGRGALRRRRLARAAARPGPLALGPPARSARLRRSSSGRCAWAAPGPYRSRPRSSRSTPVRPPMWRPTGPRSWRSTTACYELQPTPVVALNRALALAELARPGGGAGGDRAARRAAGRLPPLPCRPRRAAAAPGTRDEAREADRRALALTDNPAEKRLLTERIAAESE